MLTSKMIGILESKYEDLQKLIGSLLVIEAEKRTFKVEELSGLINENFLFSFIHMLEEAGGLKVIRDDFDPRLKEYDIDGRNLKVILYESEILKNYLESLKCQAALNNRFEIVGNVLLIVNRIDPPCANKIDPPKSNSYELVVMQKGIKL